VTGGCVPQTRQSTVRQKGTSFYLRQLVKNCIIHCADAIVFIEKCPTHYAAFIDHKYCRLCDLAIRIEEIIRIYNLMICVGNDWKRQFKFIAQFAAFVLIVDADGDDLCSGRGKPVVVSSQTGQLLSAIRSPIAPVEHQHDFAFASVISKGYFGPFR